MKFINNNNFLEEKANGKTTELRCAQEKQGDDCGEYDQAEQDLHHSPSGIGQRVAEEFADIPK